MFKLSETKQTKFESKSKKCSFLGIADILRHIDYGILKLNPLSFPDIFIVSEHASSCSFLYLQLSHLHPPSYSTTESSSSMPTSPIQRSSPTAYKPTSPLEGGSSKPPLSFIFIISRLYSLILDSSLSRICNSLNAFSLPLSKIFALIPHLLYMSVRRRVT